MKCYCYGKVGHERTDGHSNIKCFACKENGHISTECPNNRNKRKREEDENKSDCRDNKRRSHSSDKEVKRERREKNLKD